VSSAVRASRARRLALPVSVTPDFGVALGVGALLLWLAFRDGGYFPITWNVASLLLLWLVVVVLVWRRHVTLGRLDAALLIGLAGLLLWTWMSALWSIAPAASVLEGERTLCYLSGGAAALFLGSRSGARSGAIAVATAATLICGYALADRLVAVSPLPYNRLSGPVGYWNSLGILASAGVCLSLALVAHERRRLARAAAGSSIPILVGALYLTFSRGSWLALGVGLAVSVCVDPRRRELAAAVSAQAIPSLAVLATAASARALTSPTAPPKAITADAHWLGLCLVLTSAASAWLAILAPRLATALPKPPRSKASLSAVAVIASIGVISLVLVAGPARLGAAALAGFDGSPPSTTSDLTTHLASLSGSGRSEYWRVAVSTFASSPLAGNGAGSYGRLWLMGRHQVLTVQDAHNVYLETLAELGMVGAVLLLSVLAVPLVAARRVIARAYIPALTAAYIAFLVHASIDWDWEMPVVTMTQLACGAAIVTAAGSQSPALRRNVRIGALITALGLAACALAFLVGNRRLSAAAAAAARGHGTLTTRAQAAEQWAPWSPDPEHWLATIQLDRGNRLGARRLLAAALAKDQSDWSLWLEMAAASDGTARDRAILMAARLNPEGPDVLQTSLRYGLITESRAQPGERHRSEGASTGRPPQ
jgi:hypothetical protein